MNSIPQCVTTTYHRSYNYGATLQAYALQQTLLGIGFENHILDFYRDPFENPPIFSGHVKVDFARMLIRIYGIRYRKEKKRLIREFDNFTTNYLRTTKQYQSLEELIQCPPHADCYITGSDQVLTVREPEFVVERNLLTFVHDVPKYSYAASLASYDLNSGEQKQLSDAINCFEMLSVREKETVDYLESFCKCNIRTDVDPVFLLRKIKWERIASSPKYNNKYILYFQVNANPAANQVLTKLKEKYNLPIVCLQTNPFVRVKADKVVLDASPEEFLGWIQNSEIVVTTSFHGTALSLLFNRTFFSLTKENSNPVRIQSLLSQVELEDRLITSVTDIDCVKSIDWNRVNTILDDLQEISLNYLKKIYNDTKQRIQSNH